MLEAKDTYCSWSTVVLCAAGTFVQLLLTVYPRSAPRIHLLSLAPDKIAVLAKTT